MIKMIKMSDWGKDIEEADVILKKKLELDPNLKARLDAELYKCSLLKELEEEKAKEKEKEKNG